MELNFRDKNNKFYPLESVNLGSMDEARIREGIKSVLRNKSWIFINKEVSDRLQSLLNKANEQDLKFESIQVRLLRYTSIDSLRQKKPTIYAEYNYP